MWTDDPRGSLTWRRGRLVYEAFYDTGIPLPAVRTGHNAGTAKFKMQVPLEARLRKLAGSFGLRGEVVRLPSFRCFRV